MKSALSFIVILAVFSFAYFSAQEKMNSPLNVQALHLGMSIEGLERAFGVPSARDRNQLTYVFDDGSELLVTLRDKIVSSARLKFHRPVKIEDPMIGQLTLVQMDSNTLNEDAPSWFFAGKPEEGLIYKITSDGKILSLTWVPPFIHGDQPKHLHALLRDFKANSFKL